MRYAVVLEKSANGYGAYVPDMPGCVAVGKTIDETMKLIKEAIKIHIDGLQEDGEQIPAPTTVCEYVEATQ